MVPSLSKKLISKEFEFMNHISKLSIKPILVAKIRFKAKFAVFGDVFLTTMNVNPEIW